MKKYIIIALSVLALGISFTSCQKINNGILNGDPYDSFTKGNYFTSEKNVELFANYFYNTWVGYGGTGTNGLFYFPTLNDNQTPTGYTEWSYTSVPATNGTWGNSYTEIRRANTLIDAIPGIDNMSDASKNNWIGIARLYRAWYHYILVRTFGDCYWVDKVLDTADEDILYGPRQDRDEVMDKVLEDLNFAVANITANGSSRTAVNVWVAQAIKSEICLYEGTFCKYRSANDGQKAADASRASRYLTECKTASQAIMNNSSYAVSPTYKAIYNSFDLSKGDAAQEMILYKKYQYSTFVHSLIDYCCGSTQQKGLTKDAFDAYLFTDGECLANTSMDTNDHGKVKEIEAGGYRDSGTYVVDLTDVLATRDPRLAATIDDVLLPPGLGYRRYQLGAESTCSTGYGVQKYDNPEFTDASRRNATNGGDTDAPIFWLSNILLNYAEACAELGGITQSDLDNSVNKLRARAGMPNMTTSPKADPANNMGVSDLIWEIRRERRVELMFDNNDRYWSLIRWHQLDKLDQTQNPNLRKGGWLGNEIWSADAGLKEKTTIDANGYIDCSNGTAGRKYDKKYYLNPIPSGESTLNPQIGQNPGW
ncbi:MAG: RagB/SusD family nutrient uptake outer membrane protein [Bacteroidales bacterium]|nr:RagB/SusD family nutrient uptake outer membrane protein [Bacteroidales bacterium]